jgi:hypothetical protein
MPKLAKKSSAHDSLVDCDTTRSPLKNKDGLFCTTRTKLCLCGTECFARFEPETQATQQNSLDNFGVGVLYRENKASVRGTTTRKEELGCWPANQTVIDPP